MLGTDKARSDILAGAHLYKGNPEILLSFLSRY
jgi:hypothetical protein